MTHTQRLGDAGIRPSVGAVGSSADNALAESINGLYKTEVIRPRGPCRTVDAVEIATAEWVDRYNTRRFNQYAGDMPHAVLEAVPYAQQQPPSRRLTGVKQSSLRTCWGGSISRRRSPGSTWGSTAGPPRRAACSSWSR